MRIEEIEKMIAYLERRIKTLEAMSKSEQSCEVTPSGTFYLTSIDEIIQRKKRALELWKKERHRVIREWAKIRKREG